MKRKNLRYSFIISLVIVSLWSCRGLEQASQVNISQIYDLEPNRPEVDVRIFTSSDTTFQAYLRLSPPPAGEAWDVRYVLLKNYQSSIPLDTGSLLQLVGGQYFNILYKEIPIKAGNDYIVRFEVMHTGRSRKFNYLVPVQSGRSHGPQSVLPLRADGSIHFKDYLLSNEEINFRVPDHWNEKSLSVLYFKEFRAIATPPFNAVAYPSFRNKPDSIFQLRIDSFHTERFTAQGQGIYLIITDSTLNRGISFISPVTGYPYISNADQMIHTARYIMSNKEFKMCVEAADKKTSIDAFWIDISGNPNRARSLMADYYKRVEEANKLFIADTEGWKTDRGMIYIVFGPPDIVYQEAETETWIYGELGYSRSLTLRFNRFENPFTDKDFRLERMPNYKDPWYVAVNQWRR